MSPAPFANVIVTYNNRADIGGLLGDLDSHAPASRTILIDNASTDGTAEWVQSEFPQVQLIRNPRNVGYARAVNQGISLADTQHVFLLNPDIRIDSARVFEALQRCLDEEPRVAVAGPLQFKGQAHGGQLNFTWSYWTPDAFKLYCSHLIGRPVTPPEPLKVAFLNAGCLFIRQSAFKAVGGFNERYFLYGEEPDLFFKFMRHGYECRLVASVWVHHAREQSLRTLPSPQRVRFKLAGSLNIADAVCRGLGNLILDKLLHRQLH